MSIAIFFVHKQKLATDNFFDLVFLTDTDRYSQDNYLAVIPVVLPLLLLISYGLLSADLVRDIVHQKHFGMKVVCLSPEFGNSLIRDCTNNIKCELPHDPVLFALFEIFYLFL